MCLFCEVHARKEGGVGGDGGGASNPCGPRTKGARARGGSVGSDVPRVWLQGVRAGVPVRVLAHAGCRKGDRARRQVPQGDRQCGESLTVHTQCPCGHHGRLPFGHWGIGALGHWGIGALGPLGAAGGRLGVEKAAVVIGIVQIIDVEPHADFCAANSIQTASIQTAKRPAQAAWPVADQAAACKAIACKAVPAEFSSTTPPADSAAREPDRRGVHAPGGLPHRSTSLRLARSQSRPSSCY